jgi:hypothetical protein
MNDGVEKNETNSVRQITKETTFLRINNAKLNTLKSVLFTRKNFVFFVTYLTERSNIGCANSSESKMKRRKKIENTKKQVIMGSE